MASYRNTDQQQNGVIIQAVKPKLKLYAVPGTSPGAAHEEPFMQTIAHDFLSVPSHTAKTDAGRRPFKTIALLASLTLVMSACTVTRTPDADDGSRQATAHTHAAPGSHDPKKATGASTESSLAQSDPSRRYREETDPARRRQLVTSMFDQAAALGKEGDLSAAIPIYKEIEQIYADGSGSDKSWGAWAIFYQGDLQRQMRNPKAAVAAYERLDQRFSQETDPAIRAIVADALFKKGEALTEQGDTRAAIAAYEEIDRRYAEDRDASFRLRAVRALFAKGALLGKQGAGEDPGSESLNTGARPTGDTFAAVAVYDGIVQRFGRDKDPNIRNIVGATLLKKSEALRLVGDDQGTIAVYGEIVDRFGNDNAQGSRVLVATAFFRKGLALGKQESSSPAAIAAFDEVIRRFASDTHPTVRKTVGQAVKARQRLLDEAVPVHDN